MYKMSILTKTKEFDIPGNILNNEEVIISAPNIHDICMYYRKYMLRKWINNQAFAFESAYMTLGNDEYFNIGIGKILSKSLPNAEGTTHDELVLNLIRLCLVLPSVNLVEFILWTTRREDITGDCMDDVINSILRINEVDVERLLYTSFYAYLLTNDYNSGFLFTFYGGESGFTAKEFGRRYAIRKIEKFCEFLDKFKVRNIEKYSYKLFDNFTKKGQFVLYPEKFLVEE